MKNGISVTLSIYNQENIISRVVKGIMDNISPDVREFIILFDGCIDGTERIVKETLKQYDKPIDIKFLYAPNVNEVIANNITFKASSYDYILTIQDDIILDEPYFDQRLKLPFLRYGDVFAVSGRNASNDYVVGDTVEYREDGGIDRNMFYVRDICIRGPLMFNHLHLQQLNYLDEIYAPLVFDDHDICLRAYKQFKLVSGCFPCKYISELGWGATRSKPESASVWSGYFEKNQKIFIDRWGDYLMLPKHTENRRIY